MHAAQAWLVPPLRVISKPANSGKNSQSPNDAIQEWQCENGKSIGRKDGDEEGEKQLGGKREYCWEAKDRRPCGSTDLKRYDILCGFAGSVGKDSVKRKGLKIEEGPILVGKFLSKSMTVMDNCWN